MKKSKKIPKTLPKFSTGGNSNFNEFGQPIANSQTINNSIDSVAGAATPWYQYAKGASDMGRSMVQRDSNGVPIGSTNKQLDVVMKPHHQMIIDDASKGNYGLAAAELFLPGIGYESRSNALGLGKGINKMFSSNNGTNYQYPNGGINMRPNAEIEKQENVVAPNGDFLQADGPSHAQGGVPVSLPGNSMIFSDRLKLGKKTFAELNKVNNTNKEDKILDSNKYGSTSKTTAELMKMAKNKNSQALFNAQEALKKAKIEAYAKKMGVILSKEEQPAKFPYGGSANSDLNNNALVKASKGDDPRYYMYQGNPVMKPGLRALSKDTGVASDIGIDNYNNLLNTRIQVQNSNMVNNKTLPKFEYINDPSKGDYNTQFENYKKVYLPGFKYGGKLPKYGNGVLTPEQRFLKAKFMGAEQNQKNLAFNKMTGNTNPGFTTYNQEPLQEEDIQLANEVIDKQHGWDHNDPSTKPKPTNVYSNNKNFDWKKLGSNIDWKKLGSNIDWKKLGSNIAMGLANNAGNIYNLSRYNKPEFEAYQRLKATYLDPTAALRDATDQTRRAEYNVRGASSGNAGTYLSNRVALNAQNIINKDRIRQEYANVNAGIANFVGQYNNELARQEVIANAKNRARNRSGKGEAIGSLGSNVANQMMDNKKTNMDQETLQLIMKYYNDPQFYQMLKYFLVN